jgi:hypothetical protein
VGATGELELHNLVVTGGKATGRPWADGGALFIYGKLIARRVTFKNNNAKEDGTSSGGAVAVHYGDALFYDCTFQGNAAAANGGAVKVVGDAEFRRGSFVGNVAGALGGGIIGDFGGLTVRDVSFDNATNAAREGDSRDVYVGASGTAYLSPFVVGDQGYYAAGLGKIERAPFLPPPPAGGSGGSASIPPLPPPPISGANDTEVNGTLVGAVTGDGGKEAGGSMSIGAIAGGIVAVLLIGGGGGYAYFNRLRRDRATEREIRAEHAANERALAEREQDMKELRERAISNKGGRSSTGGKRAEDTRDGHEDIGGGGGGGGGGGEEDEYRDGAPRRNPRASSSGKRSTDRGGARVSVGSMGSVDEDLVEAQWAGAAAEARLSQARISQTGSIGGSSDGGGGPPVAGRLSVGGCTSRIQLLAPWLESPWFPTLEYIR